MKKLLFLMICMSSVAVAQTSTMVDPATRIAWPRITGAGTPASLGFTCTATNYGQPFLDTATTPNTSSTCGTAGWQSSDGIATNAVVTNPSASQKVVQPYGTSLEVNYLEGILSQSFTDSARQRLSIWSRRMHYAPTTAGAATHVLIIGDSQTRCWVGNGCGVGPTLSSQRWGELVGQTLQGAFGSAGLGVQPLMFGFANPSQVDPQYYSVTGSVSYVATIGPTWTYGGTTQGSLMQLSSGQVVTFSTPVPYDTLKVACASATGSSGLSVAIDGSAAGTVCGETTSVPTAQYDASTTVGLAVHSATLTCATGPCFLWGVGGAAGNTGISVDYSAIASGGSGSFSSTSQLAIIDAMMMPDLPGLVIIDLGTNDTYLGTLTSLTANLEAIIANIIATATANGDSGFIPSFLLVVPPASNIASSSVMQQVAQNVIAAANATGVDVVSIQDRWGTSYVANQNLYGSDGIHPNTYGSGDEAATILQHVLDVVPSPVSSTNTWPYLQTFQAGIAAPYIEPLVTANPTGGCLTGAFLDATTGVFSSCVGGVWIQGLKASVFEPSVATAPTGSCGPNGTLVLALDGSLSVCRGYVYGPLSGGVTSVGLALPSLFTVSGSPVTGSGTLTAILASQAANQVFANCTGSSATPSFCSLTAAMIPSLAATYAPLANPTAGQHNYAPLASPTFTGSVVIPGGTIDSTVIGGTTAAAVTATALTVAPVSGSQIGNFLTFYYDSARTEQAIIIDQAGGLRAQGGFYDGSNYLNSVAIGASQVVGPATAPTGSCSTNGAWVFSQDGHATFCASGTWMTKI
jgi:lysophospholipase L1-like esterase